MNWKNEEVVMIEKKKSGVTLLEYPLLSETGIVKHCFTTREGGVSKGIFSTMNLSFTRGDEKEAVEENYRRLADAMGVKYEDFIFTDQTHTTNVRVVTREDAGKGLTRERDYRDVDGLITKEPGLVLSAFFADCVPLYFVDPVKRAIGLSHSGWRGTVGKIGKVTVESMMREFGTDPKDLICAIGPSICQECYEISEDVAEEFRKGFPGREAEIMQKTGEEKYHLDLWKANKLVLMEAGVKEEKIAVTNLCTCCNSNRLFSHRASRGKRGNLGAFLCLKEEN
ncbi:MAG: peptidoglycan editing factor PgeF [Roseburia sp.]